METTGDNGRDLPTTRRATRTHEACTITGFQHQTFVCPCHGSHFNTSGGVLNGPATRSLPQFSTQVAGGVPTISM